MHIHYNCCYFMDR